MVASLGTAAPVGDRTRAHMHQNTYLLVEDGQDGEVPGIRPVGHRRRQGSLVKAHMSKSSAHTTLALLAALVPLWRRVRDAHWSKHRVGLHSNHR